MLRLEHIWSLWMNHLVKEQFPNPIQLFSTIIVNFWWKDSIAKVISNHYSRREKVLWILSITFSFRESLLKPLFFNHIQSWQNIWLRRAGTSNFWSCFQQRDWHQISIIKINDWIWDPRKRVFSGVSAILEFEIINFREYDCSIEPESPNCQIVELFLTVDNSRKMQNGVNIDESIDR